jgi:hypothetical protein
VVDHPSSKGTTREEGQEFRVVLEGIVGPIRVRLFAILVLILVFFVLEVRIRAERAPKLLIIWRWYALLLIIVRIRRSVLVEILSVSVLQKLIVLSLIISGELRPLPLFEVFSRPIIILIHVLLDIMLPLLFFLLSFSGFSLPVHIIEIFLSESVT